MAGRFGAFVVLVLLWAGIWFAYTTWTAGEHDSDYEEHCIGGHVRLVANWAAKGMAVTKFDQNGIPIRCD